jgi:hypothetical protein
VKWSFSILSALLSVALAGSVRCGRDPHITDLTRYGVTLIDHGKQPAGAATFDRFWIYGGDVPYPELRSALQADLEKAGWRTAVRADPVTPGGLSIRDRAERKVSCSAEPQERLPGRRVKPKDSRSG